MNITMKRFAGLATLLVVLAAAGSAQAAGCEGYGSAPLDASDAPKTLAGGRTATFEAYYSSSGSTLTVEAADPARPISHPYIRANLPDDATVMVTVKTERGDGPVRVRINGTE